MRKINMLFTIAILFLGITTGCSAPAASAPISPAAASPASASASDTAFPASASDGDALFASSPQQEKNTSNSITVNSSEKISLSPDIAQIVYAIRTEAREAAQCQQQNTQSAATVIALLKDLGIEDHSIQTSDYYMNPIYNYSGNTAKVTGYEAVTTLTVSDIAIDRLDQILAASVNEGINTIRSITYMASNYDEGYQKALEKAVASAYQKAQVLANASGKTIGSVKKITETSGYTQARYNDSARSGMYSAMKEAAYDLADTAGIMAGEIEVEAGIIMEYELY